MPAIVGNEGLGRDLIIIKHKEILVMTIPGNRAILKILLKKILHQLICSLSHYLQGFIHSRWCRISSINSIMSFPFVWLWKMNDHWNKINCPPEQCEWNLPSRVMSHRRRIPVLNSYMFSLYTSLHQIHINVTWPMVLHYSPSLHSPAMCKTKQPNNPPTASPCLLASLEASGCLLTCCMSLRPAKLLLRNPYRSTGSVASETTDGWWCLLSLLFGSRNLASLIVIGRWQVLQYVCNFSFTNQSNKLRFPLPSAKTTRQHSKQ